MTKRNTPSKAHFAILRFAIPHHAVKNFSIARRLRNVMADAGINMIKFKVHSTRSVTVAKVPLSGLSVMEIAKLGDWGNATAVFKFYRKEIKFSSSDSVVQKSILRLS